MLIEKSKSKSQQKLMGMVYAYQKGKLNTKKLNKELLSKIKTISIQMKQKDVKDFAKTKHDKLPQKVENLITNFNDYSIGKLNEESLGRRIF